MVAEEDEEVRRQVVGRIANLIGFNFNDVLEAYKQQPKNVRLILRRHEYALICPSDDRPVCTFIDQAGFIRALVRASLKKVLFVLARLYDEAHVALYRASKPNSRFEGLRQNPRISLRECGKTLQNLQDIDLALDDMQILIERVGYADTATFKAVFREMVKMDFDELPELNSLADALPGEDPSSERLRYAGIGGGGGSDIISASILGVLLENQNKGKKMDLLVSTRTWATGSQGKKGAKIGSRREVSKHGGQVKRITEGADGSMKETLIGGTYKILPETSAEGRHLESIPLKIPEPHHKNIVLVLDQGESPDVPPEEKAKLEDQLRAILEEENERLEKDEKAQEPRIHTLLSVDGGGSALNTIISVDTGGDVFGVDSTGGTTPDQDYRVQKAISEMNSTWTAKHNLVTAVVAPGVDAPRDAPSKAKKAGGKRYVLKEQDKKTILDLLEKYEMDGKNPDRFGKTTLALQARLHGSLGWTSLNLPEYVIDTWENPWNSFVYIRKCMSEIILMPTQELLKLIAPKQDIPKQNATKQEVQKNGSKSPTLKTGSRGGSAAYVNGSKKEKSPARSPDPWQNRNGPG